jgi:hypothetical protein
VRRGRYERTSVGLNPNLQIVASDANGSPYDLGLFIGANDNSNTPSLRQLFVLAAARFGTGQRGRLVGFREYLTLYVNIAVTAGTGAAFYPLERPVETPTWKYTDGNVLWGIRRLPISFQMQPSLLNAEGFAFQWSDTAAQLFQSVAGPIITPPYGGLFPGQPLSPAIGRMNDLRCRRWSEEVTCDVPFEGPCIIALMASVQQTNPATRTPPPAPGVELGPVPFQFSGADEPPDNADTMYYTVVTTSGGSATIGQLLYSNGSGTGVQSVFSVPTGTVIIPATTFTGGTITLNGGQPYEWNGTAWVPTADSTGDQFLVTQGTVPEDAFVQNYPGSTYGRIAGSLIFQEEEQAPTGAPKTYRRPGDADRLTRDTAETGDNVIRRSAEDTNEYKSCWDKPMPGFRGATTPPHASAALGELPKADGKTQEALRTISKRWRETTPKTGEKSYQISPKPQTKSTIGLGNIPKDQQKIIQKITNKWRSGEVKIT